MLMRSSIPAIRTLRLAGIAIAASVCLAGPIGAQHAPPPPAAPTPAPAPAPAPEVAPEVARTFQAGMTYADLRAKLDAAGWLPLSTNLCRQNVGGEASVCSYMPETDACSADGYCVFRFAHRASGLMMRVGTYGDYQRWKQPGHQQKLTVRWWEASRLPAPGAAAACPAGDFAAFFRAFVDDPAVRQTYTAPVVKVMELSSDDLPHYYHERAGYWPVPTYAPASNYTSFAVRRQGGQYHLLDGGGEMIRTPARVSITEPRRGTRKVRLAVDISGGRSFLFERRANCWVLTEEPDAPTP